MERKPMNPTKLGLYGGVIVGAVAMMVLGALGQTTWADLSLVMGMAAGPAIGWVVGRVQERRAAKALRTAEPDASNGEAP